MFKIDATYTIISSWSNLKDIINRVNLVTSQAFFVTFKKWLERMNNIAIMNKFKCATIPSSGPCSGSSTKIFIFAWC